MARLKLRLKLLVRLVFAAFGGFLYLWFAGVLNAARARRSRVRKRAARRRLLEVMARKRA